MTEQRLENGPLVILADVPVHPTLAALWASHFRQDEPLTYRGEEWKVIAYDVDADFEWTFTLRRWGS